ncbi:hypothetical protein NW754_013252 [Fusarium falciforme]|nr:hypothetical protein NW754_013252 [Fusarium falciforme]
MKLPWLLSPLTLGLGVIAQSFVSPPTNVQVVLSKKFPGAKISYKQVHNLCETTEGVKSFSGYVSLPKDFIPDAKDWDEDISGNFFFWYFEARDDPENAPTSIYLGGGPGYTSFDGSSVFPCYVNPDSNSTTLNKHSWNNHSNMLYIEQPLGTGFSYTKIENGTYDTLTGEFTPVVDGEALPELNVTNLHATLQAAGIGDTMNTTKTAARTLWRFAQVWFNEFPERAKNNDELAIWAVSYGGLYAPVFGSYFIDQNKKIEKGDPPAANSTVLNLVTVGLLNAMVDIRSMALGFPDFALNNTYDLPVYSEEVAEMVLGNITAPDVGCLTLVDKCRAAVTRDDPESTGTNNHVNEICFKAMGYHHFDITLNKYASFPTEYETALFNQPWVQQELGVPLNYTRGNNEIEAAFLGRTGDMVRYGLEYIGHLLENGVNVAMINGDRDFRCNWFSGENASLSIPFSEAHQFAAAGYQPIMTNASHEGGFVRRPQHGGYQPETVSAIFERAMFRSDVATGDIKLAKTPNYVSKGKASVRDVKSELPELIENICYVLQPGDTCTPEQLKALKQGTAETEDWVVVKPAGTKGERVMEGKGADGEKNSSKGSNQDGSQTTTSGGVRLTDSLAFTFLLVAVMAIV